MKALGYMQIIYFDDNNGHETRGTVVKFKSAGVLTVSCSDYQGYPIQVDITDKRIRSTFDNDTGWTKYRYYDPEAWLKDAC